jgi:signal transduction histidine kinase
VGYFTFDRNAAILQVNLTGAALLGLERSRLLKRRFHLFVAEENRLAFMDFLDRVFINWDKQACEIQLLSKREPLYVRIEAVAAVSGAECRAVVMDTTENKRMQDLIRMRMHLMEYASGHTLEEVLRETVDNMEYLVGSPIGFFLIISPDQKNIISQTWSIHTPNEFLNPKDHRPHYPVDEGGSWVECISQRKPVIHNIYTFIPNNKGMTENHSKFIRHLVVPVIRDGKVVAILGVGNKPTEYTQKDVERVSFLADVAWTAIQRKQADEALLKHSEQLEFLNKELESFSYSVSHDLRAPLRAIDGYTRMILKKQGDKFDEDIMLKFNKIRHGVETMNKLIDDILAFSRLGRKELVKVNINMHTLSLNAWEKIKSATNDRYTFSIEDDIPPARGDEALISQVVINLLSNAVKFTKNVETPLIEVGGSIQGNDNVYYIKDNGAGFDMNYYDKLFAVFQRLHSAENFEGTGIGLAIVQRIISRHGGRVWAHGEVDHGAIFYFTLPRG